MKRLLVFVLLGLVSFACAPPQEDATAVRKQIEAMTEKAERDLIAGTWDSTLVHYTDDAVSMPDHEPIIRGKAALKKHSLEMLGMGMKFTKVEFTTTDVTVRGSLAFEIGTFAMTLDIPNVGVVDEQGKYLTIYEKVADGSWKIKVETWNTDKMPGMPGMPGGGS